MAGTPLKIIVGLGNPGPEHLLTRHNAGFWFVDALAAKAGARFRSHTRFQGEICRTQLSGGEVTLLKPMTYMNRSGLAIRALVDYLKVSPAEVLVAHVRAGILDPATLRVDRGAYAPIGRLFGGGYVRTHDRFEMPRLTYEQWLKQARARGEG